MKIEFVKIGEVQFERSSKAKYIRISLKPFEEIRVILPKRADIRDGITFVEMKTDWILQAKTRVAMQEKQRIIFTQETDFSTKNHKLKLYPWKSDKFRAHISKDALSIFYPHEIDLQSEKAQVVIRDFIIQTLRKEAKEYLPKRTEQLAAKYGFLYNGVTMKNLTSRWGSCSAKNHINLNIHLIRLPDHLSDYVILHELTHTVHKNHGKLFWQHLNKLTEGNAKKLSSEMQKYAVSQKIM